RESRASRRSRKRDWYIWRDSAANGGPPNNWLSVFGGSAWEYDGATGQYYYHAFLAAQPDLNWRNPAVRAAIYEVMRFWFARGVDGFRIGVVSGMIKDALLRDDPEIPAGQARGPSVLAHHDVFSSNQPEVHEVLREMRAVADQYPGRVLIGEAYLPIAELVRYYGTDLHEVQLPFNFVLLDLPWTAPAISAAIEAYEAALPPGAWPNWVLGNHDRPRVASRVGAAQARVAQLLLLTLRGTPTLYNGDELGMHDVAIPPARIVDPAGRFAPHHSRDPERTPMQWDASPYAGFSPVEPWLPLADDYAVVNVTAERADPRSQLALVHQLLALRREYAVLAVGSYHAVA